MQDPIKHRLSQKKYRAANLEKCRERERLWRIRNRGNRGRYAFLVRRWKEQNHEYVLKYAREWRKKNQAERNSYLKKWRDRNHQKMLAHSAVERALVSGKLVKPKRCQSCGKKSPVDGHHADYAKRLEVRWLCRRCHNNIHHGGEKHERG